MVLPPDEMIRRSPEYLKGYEEGFIVGRDIGLKYAQELLEKLRKVEPIAECSDTVSITTAQR